MRETEQAFDVVDFLALDAFRTSYTINGPDKALPSFGQKEAEIIFEHYGNNNVDILKNIRKDFRNKIFWVSNRKEYFSKAGTEQKLK